MLIWYKTVVVVDYRTLDMVWNGESKVGLMNGRGRPEQGGGGWRPSRYVARADPRRDASESMVLVIMGFP